MSTSQNHKKNVTGARARATAKKKSKRNLVVFTVEIILLLLLLAIIVVIGRDVFNPKGSGPKVTVLDPGKLSIPEEIQQAKEEGVSNMTGYMNIALFGVDAVNEKQLYKNSRSDSMMIASVNMETGDIKLVSLYRDTLLNLGTDDYLKCNHAYSYGGAEQAIKMMNMNLDMDIENFVTVGYNGLIEVIDGLGGIYVDVKENEIKHLNNYQISIVAQWKYGVKLTDDTPQSAFNVVKKGDYTPVTEAGLQKLDGLQATAYCRIRYVGDDYQRTERQRTVLKAIETQAKKTSLPKLTEVFNSVIDDVYTSLDQKDLLELLGNISKYSIVDEGGFPQEDLRTSGNLGAKGSCIVPKNLESNVVWLHQFLFDDEDYEVTETVKDISKKIKSIADPYLN